jgi:phage tail-like protein
MQHLPALYRREESQQRNFLRALVGVLETGTKALDERIAGLGRHIHPDTAPPEWLDFVARWLDLPWDDALDEATKREIVRSSAVLARGRGTRAGLEALLAILLPARSFRIADDTTERGFAIVGGAAAQGAVLPAMLGGLPASSAQLNVKARLGCLRLSPDGAAEDDTSRFTGRIAIDVSTSVGDRGAAQPWLAAMVTDMVPATARVQIRRVPPEAFADDRLGDELELTAPQPPHLGSTAVAGSTRLPDRSTTLSGWGFDSGSRLQ